MLCYVYALRESSLGLFMIPSLCFVLIQDVDCQLPVPAAMLAVMPSYHNGFLSL